MTNVPLDDLESELKQLIIDSLQLEDVTAADIESDEQLFGTGLALDSIDALELGVALRKKYGIQITAVDDDIKVHFSTVRHLAQFIDTARNKAGEA